MSIEWSEPEPPMDEEIAETMLLDWLADEGDVIRSIRRHEDEGREALARQLVLALAEEADRIGVAENWFTVAELVEYVWDEVLYE